MTAPGSFVKRPGSLLPLFAGLACGALLWPAAAPAQAPIPEIKGGRVEQVTVDLVVLDRKGNAVTNLKREDFSVFEEGRPQALVSFDVIDRRPGSEAAQSAPEPAKAPRVASNQEPLARRDRLARTFVILFDDLHIGPLVGNDAKTAVAAFLDRGSVEGDRVTLIATSASAWWSTQMKGGRDDLMAVLKRLEGRRILETHRERITDYEALQIFYYHDVRTAQRVQDRLDRYGTTLVQHKDKEIARSQMEFFARGLVDPFIEARAQETYLKMKSRMRQTLEAIERATRALSEGPERKALILVSEGFVEDPAQEGFRRVVEAARRVNAALYFVDAGGLRALDPGYSAELGAPMVSGDTMTAIADLSREADGSALLADQTGGFSIRSTNAFNEGAARIGRESQSYYLLGYLPGDIPHDGRFRKIEVKVNGRYTVRARKGYYAPLPSGELPAPEQKGVDAPIQHALDAPRALDAIPLRLTAYVLDDSATDRCRVMFVADVDVSKVQFQPADGQAEPQAALDTLLVVSARDSAEVQRTDQKAEIQRRASGAEGPTWYSFVRELTLGAGPHQAKLVVRDIASGRVASVIHELSVPAAGKLRVSTPILTDKLTQSAGGAPTPALVTLREFPSGAALYVRFDVFGAAKSADGLPRVRAGHALRRSGGEVLGRSAPTLIEPTSLGALARMVQIPLRGLAPGEYELLLSVQDEVSGETRELVESFSVTPPRAASR